MVSLLRACGSVVGIVAMLELPGPWAQAVPGGATRIPGAPGIRPTTRVFLVDDTPNPCRFSASIQAAVDAASDGDVVLVKGGGYSSVEVNAKSLYIIGENRPALSGITFRNCAGSVVLRGFELFGPTRTIDCPGFAWIEDCTTSLEVRNGRAGLFRRRPTLNNPYSYVQASLGSTLVAYHSIVQAWHGFSGCGGCSGSTDGSTAAWVLNSSVAYVIGSRLAGGAGGDGEICTGCFDACYDGGCGGDGLVVDPSSSAYVLDTLLAGGAGGYQPCGAPDCSGQAYIGPVELVPRDAGEFWIDAPVLNGQPLQLHARGPAGWSVYTRQWEECVPSFEPAFRGYALVPISRPPVLLGVLPANGQLDVTVPVGHLLQPGAEARVVFVQADFYDPSTDISVLGTPTAVVVYRDSCP